MNCHTIYISFSWKRIIFLDLFFIFSIIPKYFVVFLNCVHFKKKPESHKNSQKDMVQLYGKSGEVCMFSIIWLLYDSNCFFWGNKFKFYSLFHKDIEMNNAINVNIYDDEVSADTSSMFQMFHGTLLCKISTLLSLFFIIWKIVVREHSKKIID